MGAIAAGAMLFGAGVKAFGDIKSANSQAELERDKAVMAYRQADELEQRQMANDAVRQGQAFKAEEDFGAAYAGSGKEGSGLGSQLEIKRQADLAVAMADRDADFQAEMLRHGGDINNKLADETQTAGYLKAGGTILSAGGNFATSKFLFSGG